MFRFAVSATTSLLLAVGSGQAASLNSPKEKSEARAKVKASLARLPMHFEKNSVQAGPRVNYLARGKGYTVLLTSQGSVLSANKGDAAIGMELVGSNAAAKAGSVQDLPGTVNYYVGNDPKKWITDVSTSAKVRYQEIYPGVDLVYYGNQERLEYDFVIAPGADPKAIKLRFHGADKMRLDSNGDLVLRTQAGEVRHHKPIMYQEVNGARQPIAGNYVLKGKRQVGFKVAAVYDSSKPLVIDPTLSYGTFLGGTGEDDSWGIAIDPAGNFYITGQSNSLSSGTTATPTGAYPNTFPLKSWWTLANPGNPRSETSGDLCCKGNDTGRAVITKFDPTGATLVYSSYIGGFAGTDGAHKICAELVPPVDCGTGYFWARGWDVGYAIAVDRQGNAYIVGQNESMDFPTTADAVKRFHPGPSYERFKATTPPAAPAASYGDHPRDGFLSKFDASGKLLYSTLIGGNGSDNADSVAVVDSGPYQGIYVSGIAQSPNFFHNGDGTLCTTPTGCGDPTGYNDLRGMPAINSYATELNLPPTTNRPGGATLVGGVADTTPPSAYAANPGIMQGAGPYLDPVTGTVCTSCSHPDARIGTDSGPFSTASLPCYDGASGLTGTPWGWACWRDGYMMRFSLDGKQVLLSTLIGGSGDDGAMGIAVDPNTGKIYVGGETESADFPTTLGALQECHNGNTSYPGDSRLQPSPTQAVMKPYPCHIRSPQTWDIGTQKYKTYNDGHLTVFSPAGAILYSTYLGGNQDDASGAPAGNFTGGQGTAVAVDSLGIAYLAGFTESMKEISNPWNCGLADPNTGAGSAQCPTQVPFTTTLTAYKDDIGAPFCAAPCAPAVKARPMHANTWLAKIDPTKTGSAALLYATYVGGNGDDEAYGIAIDGVGGAYVVGYTDSGNFPSKLALEGQRWIGGAAADWPATSAPQYADAFVYKIDTTLAGEASLVYSTYIGGAGDEEARGVVYVNQAGFKGVYICGFTASDGLPHDAEPGYPGSPTCNPDGSVAADPSAPGNSKCPGTMVDGKPAPFKTTAGAFMTTHAPGRKATDSVVYPDTGTPIPAEPPEDIFIAKIADVGGVVSPPAPPGPPPPGGGTPPPGGGTPPPGGGTPPPSGGTPPPAAGASPSAAACSAAAGPLSPVEGIAAALMLLALSKPARRRISAASTQRR